MVTIDAIGVDENYSVSGNTVTWTVTVPANESVADYVFRIYRSYAPESNYEIMCDDRITPEFNAVLTGVTGTISIINRGPDITPESFSFSVTHGADSSGNITLIIDPNNSVSVYVPVHTTPQAIVTSLAEHIALHLPNYSASVNNNMITITAVDTYVETPTLTFVDTSVNLLSNTINYYYKIEAKHRSTLATQMSTVIGYSGSSAFDGVAYAITHQEQYILRYIVHANDASRKVKILLRKRTGQHCPVCWDNIKRQPTKSICTSCYNVGFNGGYFQPISVYMSINSPSTSLDIAINDVEPQDSVVTGWLGNYPLVQEDDIVIDRHNRRYRILHTQRTLRGTSDAILRQVIAMQRLPLTDIVYKIGVV